MMIIMIIMIPTYVVRACRKCRQVQAAWRDGQRRAGAAVAAAPEGRIPGSVVPSLSLSLSPHPPLPRYPVPPGAEASSYLMPHMRPESRWTDRTKRGDGGMPRPRSV